MINVRNKLKEIYKSDYFPFIILFIGMSIVHIIIKMNFGDDLYFKEVLKENKLLDWLKLRYMTWSSRIIIEFVMVILLGYSIVLWRIFDVAVIILLGVSISYIFIEENKRKNNWIVVLLIFLYPFIDMSSAGWGATTLNYLWPLSFGIYTFVIIKKIFCNNKIKWYEYIFSTLALIFATNQEQMCAILIAMYCLLSIYFILKNKCKIYIIFQTFICLSSFIFILTCPGNASRKVTEIGYWFADYNMLSFVNKLDLGFSSTMGKFIFSSNLIFIVFSSLVCTATFIRYKSKLFRIISAIPFVGSIYFPYKSQFATSITQYGIITFDNFTSIKGYIYITLLGMIGLCGVLSLYFCFENRNKAFLSIFIVLLGTASRLVMGLSPTIWASCDRTFIFMYFSLIISSIMVYNEICKSNYMNFKLINYILTILSIFSFVTIICDQV